MYQYKGYSGKNNKIITVNYPDRSFIDFQRNMQNQFYTSKNNIC